MARWHDRPPQPVVAAPEPAIPTLRRSLAGDVKFRPQISCDSRQVASVLVVPGRQLEGDADAILRAGLKQARAWARDGLTPPPITVELPAIVAESAQLAQPLLWEIDRQDCAPGQVIFSAPNPGRYAQPLDGLALLSRHGCGIELDCLDPMGMTVIRDLKPLRARMRVPADFLPEDLRAPRDGQLILSLLALAERHGLATLVDDVRSRDRFECLAQMGFSVAQGDAIAPVLDGDATAQFLHNVSPRPKPHDRQRWPAA